MIGWLLLLTVVVAMTATVLLPGYALVRLLGGGPIIALGTAPALAAAVSALAAIAAGTLGVSWSMLPWLVAWLLLIGPAWWLHRTGRLRGLWPVQEPTAPWRELWAMRPLRLLLPVAVAVALGPTLASLGRADGVLERWDALYHLNALTRVRLGGDGSSFVVGQVSNSAGRPVFYPAAFHDLAALVPSSVPVPIAVNGTILVLGVIPWVIGCALLARVLWPADRRGPAVAMLGALLVPAAPFNEWIHLSAMPNLSGMAMLPGVLAAAVLLWRGLLEDRTPWARRLLVLTPGLVVLAAAGLGMALMQPNTAVMALLLIAVLTAVTSAPQWRTRPALLIVPLLMLLPIAVLRWTALGATATSFVGGLQVSWWTALLEILAGLHTVWPMALGVGMALLWWPGLVVTALDSSTRWLAAAWVLVATLYFDAAIDSALDLTVLFYRGQDRISMPLAMLCVLLLVPGLRAVQSVLERHADGWLRQAGAGIAAAITIVLVASSVTTRYENAQKNLAADYPGRGRFLQADERAVFDAEVPTLPRGTVVANPFSGGAHLYALYGMPVRFPVAGMSYRDIDAKLVDAVTQAAVSPSACRFLEDMHVMYVYQDLMPYQRDPRWAPIDLADPGFGQVVLSTPHSQLIRVDCRAVT